MSVASSNRDNQKCLHILLHVSGRVVGMGKVRQSTLVENHFSTATIPQSQPLLSLTWNTGIPPLTGFPTSLLASPSPSSRSQSNLFKSQNKSCLSFVFNPPMASHNAKHKTRCPCDGMQDSGRSDPYSFLTTLPLLIALQPCWLLYHCLNMSRTFPPRAFAFAVPFI